jgi:hypothetical protein
VADGDERDQRVREALRNAQVPEPPGADRYVGLTRTEAEQLAAREGRVIVDRSPSFESRRANLVSRRVNLMFDERDLVVRADIG